MSWTLRKLEQLLRVSELGSFSKAAEVLGLSQPALSKSVTDIEEHFDVQIFDRSPNGVRLTAAGEVVIANAARLIRQAKILESNLTSLNRGMTGTVSIGVGPTVASMILPILGRELIGRRRGLSLLTSINSPHHLLERLEQDEIELFICGGGMSYDREQFYVRSIVHLSYGLYVRAGHPLTQSSTIGLDALADFALLTATQPRKRPDLYPLISSVPRSSTFCCDNFDILKQMVATTDAIWLTTDLFAKDEADAGRIFRLPISPVHLSMMTINIVSHRNRALSCAARIVEATCVDILGGFQVSNPSM